MTTHRLVMLHSNLTPFQHSNRARRRLDVPEIRRLNLTSLPCVQGSLEEGEGKGRWDDRRRGAQEPAACVEGRLRTRGWPGHLLFMSSREWEGNGVSHDGRKDVKRQRASLF